MSLRNVEDLLFERGIDISHETIRFWWNRFGPMFAADIGGQRVSRMKGYRHWHVDLKREERVQEPGPHRPGSPAVAAGCHACSAAELGRERTGEHRMSAAGPVYPYAFEAEIERFGVGKVRKIWYNVLFLPPDLRSQLPFDIYPRLRVEGEIADVPVANAFIPAGDGRNYVIVSPRVLQDAGVKPGDFVEMRFRVADQDHVDVPETLQIALERDPDAIAAWNSLTPGRQRMAVQHVLSAKSAPTLQRRIDEALDAIVHFRGDLNARRRSAKA